MKKCDVMLVLEDLIDWMKERRRDVSARMGGLVDRLNLPLGGLKKADPNRLTAEDALLLPRREASVPDNVCVYAVGDIHGRADLLKKLMEKIRADVKKRNQPTVANAIVFLGDYIDRGFQSRQVIDLLVGGEYDDFELRFLKGNHEQTFLEFLQNPAVGPRWAQYGGRETLVSYDVQPPRIREDEAGWEAARQKLLDVIPRTPQLSG
jgi:serine/threonine protein phosphatase 1